MLKALAIESSRFQSSGLPGRGYTEDAVAVVTPPVADIEAVPVEAADDDVVTVRADARGTSVDASVHQVDASDFLVGSQSP